MQVVYIVGGHILQGKDNGEKIRNEALRIYITRLRVHEYMHVMYLYISIP